MSYRPSETGATTGSVREHNRTQHDREKAASSRWHTEAEVSL